MAPALDSFVFDFTYVFVYSGLKTGLGFDYHRVFVWLVLDMNCQTVNLFLSLAAVHLLSTFTNGKEY